ncbi:unnamed protein product, partial [Prorocentrum cordatum]
DPEMKNTFWNVVTSVGLTEGAKQTSKWQPKKFFIDKYGAEEAEEMMENGTLMSKKNPLNPKRKLHLDISDEHTKELTRGKRREVTGQKAIEGMEFDFLSKALKKG